MRVKVSEIPEKKRNIGRIIMGVVALAILIPILIQAGSFPPIFFGAILAGIVGGFIGGTYLSFVRYNLQRKRDKECA